MILRRSPAPPVVPPDTTSFLRRRAEMPFFDEAAIRMRNEQAYVAVTAQQCSHSGGGKLAGAVVGMPLASIFQPDGEHEGYARRATGGGQHPHLSAGGIQSQIERIATHGRRTGVGRVG